MVVNARAEPPPPDDPARAYTVALIGNPNAGKTSLFNALTGLRAKTANYPGITVDIRKGRLRLERRDVEVIDLPGLYSLDALTPEERVAAAALQGELAGEAAPDVVVLVLDATNLERNLFLTSEVLEIQRPTIVALNLIDAADAAGIAIDAARLAEELHCPVIPVSARTKAGLEELRTALARLLFERQPPPPRDHVSCTTGCGGCPFVARYSWAGKIANETVTTPESHGQTTAAIDRVVTNPVVGVAAFLAVMLGVFYLIFSLASIPMSLIENGFAWLGERVGELILAISLPALPWAGLAFLTTAGTMAGVYRIAQLKWTRWNAAVLVLVSAWVAALPLDDFRSLIVDGVIGGVGGVVVFLPQICILFFFISLLEDSGYLARAAFVMERVMRSVGLPGKAFVPMLSAHACAIPGIMAARVIDHWRDRLVTILVLPLLTCSARLPVYAMIASLLFHDSPGNAALVFLGAYLLGIAAALVTAFALKHSILRGETEPLILELPPYRVPSLRNAVQTVLDRAVSFVQNAGTLILMISVILWALATFPRLPESALPADVAARVAALHDQADQAAAEASRAEAIRAEAAKLVAQEQLAYSCAGRLGRALEPVFQPLGFDWKINVGVVSSFAAREVIVSTLAIIYGVGEDAAEDRVTLTETLRRQRHADGLPVYTAATSLSLLVFYVLAMQCLPTQVVTRRETGSWTWALLQLGYMTLLAYGCALVTFQVASRVF